MSHILIEKVRIKNFRALRHVEVSLNELSLLTGANNAGKTTFLRALNAILGVSRSLLNKDDLFIDQAGHRPASDIIIDLKFIAVDERGQRLGQFDNKWAIVFAGEVNIGTESAGEFLAFRTTYHFKGEDAPEATYTLINNWESEGLGELGGFARIQRLRENIRMYYIDAQRDIEDDVRLRSSYFGKMASRLADDYAPADVEALSALIAQINEAAVDKSPVLAHLKKTLEKLNQTTQTQGAGVGITPFPRHIRDLHKGMQVDFQDQGAERFGMEYHGMGTRSWASILTAGAYIEWELEQVEKKIDAGEVTHLLFPIIALEEPEAHLHPNAQRTLYRQMKGFPGQKIISTHSPYIAGQADLEELRHFYKEGDVATIGQIDLAQLTPDDLSTIKTIIADSKGELLFSKVVVMGEGPTEEVLLSTLAAAHFGKPCFELGVNIMGVGKNYPLIHLLKFLKIEWFIFSDYDNPTVRAALDSLVRKYSLASGNIIKLNDSLEGYLYDQGYDSELKGALKSLKPLIYQNEQHRAAKAPKVEEENRRIDALSKADVLKALENYKVKAARIYGQAMLQREDEAQRCPPKIKELFEKIGKAIHPGPKAAEA